jgi:hypothetical protein
MHLSYETCDICRDIESDLLDLVHCAQVVSSGSGAFGGWWYLSSRHFNRNGLWAMDDMDGPQLRVDAVNAMFKR